LERTPIEVRLSEDGGLEVEDGENLLPRVVVCGDDLVQTVRRSLVTSQEIRVNELLFAIEVVVEGRPRHTGVLNDPVDPDRVDALGVEELVGGGDQPVAGWGLTSGRARRGDGHGRARSYDSLVMATRSA
jgi:hypothetical protein